MRRDAEIAAVAEQINNLLDDLAQTVSALNTILANQTESAQGELAMPEKGTQPGDPLATAQALTTSLNTMTARLEAVNRYGRRNRHMIYGLVASLLLDAILTVVIAIVAVEANRANDRAAQVHNQQVATCLSTNEGRKLNVQLWDYVLSIPPSQPRSDAQTKRIADFKVFLHKTFAPRDCSKI